VNKLQKKLGPLKLWQWIAIGAALGAAILILRKKETPQAEAGEVFGGTGTGAFGPIDPETGIPYAFEGGGAGSAAASGETLDQFLERIGQLKDAGLLGPEVEPGTETIIERVEKAAPGGGSKEGKGGGKGGKGGKGSQGNTGGKGHGGAGQAKATKSHPIAAKAFGKKTAAAKAHQKANAQHKAAQRGHDGKAGGKATSSGAAAAAGGNNHTSAPHPAQRILQIAQAASPPHTPDRPQHHNPPPPPPRRRR
jgi:hypothetical protein